MKAIIRVMDANFNRAREAARVLEDYGRFVLEEQSLWRELRAIRHVLAQALRHLGGARDFLCARNTAQDPGAPASQERSGDRGRDSAIRRRAPQQIGETLVANCKRLQESLRVLEEYSKGLSPRVSSVLERLRFRAYEVEAQLLGRFSLRKRFRDARLTVLLTEEIAGRPLREIAREVIEGGADAIQIREKRMTDRELLGRCRELRSMTRKRGVLFLVNDRPEIALSVGADGVHLGAEDLPIAEARRILGSGFLVGATAHDPRGARAAEAAGADTVSYGPIFSPTTKWEHLRRGDRVPKEYGTLRAVGLGKIQTVSRAVQIPVVVIGGITRENLERVVRAGAQRVAVCSDVLRAPDIRARVKAFKRILRAPRGSHRADR